MSVFRERAGAAAVAAQARYDCIEAEPGVARGGQFELMRRIDKVNGSVRKGAHGHHRGARFGFTQAVLQDIETHAAAAPCQGNPAHTLMVAAFLRFAVVAFGARSGSKMFSATVVAIWFSGVMLTNCRC